MKAGKKMVEFGCGFLAKLFSHSGIRNGHVSNIFVYSDTDATFWAVCLLSDDVIYYVSSYHKTGPIFSSPPFHMCFLYRIHVSQDKANPIWIYCLFMLAGVPKLVPACYLK